VEAQYAAKLPLLVVRVLPYKQTVAALASLPVFVAAEVANLPN